MKLLIAFFLTVVATNVYAAEEKQKARTGPPTDVAKTVSITDTRFACGVVAVEHVYVDSSGVQRLATYMVEGGGCQTN